MFHLFCFFPEQEVIFEFFFTVFSKGGEAGGVYGEQ